MFGCSCSQYAWCSSVRWRGCSMLDGCSVVARTLCPRSDTLDFALICDPHKSSLEAFCTSLECVRVSSVIYPDLGLYRLLVVANVPKYRQFYVTSFLFELRQFPRSLFAKTLSLFFISMNTYRNNAYCCHTQSPILKNLSWFFSQRINRKLVYCRHVQDPGMEGLSHISSMARNFFVLFFAACRWIRCWNATANKRLAMTIVSFLPC